MALTSSELLVLWAIVMPEKPPPPGETVASEANKCLGYSAILTLESEKTAWSPFS